MGNLFEQLSKVVIRGFGAPPAAADYYCSESVDSTFLGSGEHRRSWSLDAPSDTLPGDIRAVLDPPARSRAAQITSRVARVVVSAKRAWPGAR